jgi:septum site-determining protein MinC
VRSGQAVFYPQGDVTIVGSVASGRGSCGRWLHPRLRRLARPGHRRLDRQSGCPHFCGKLHAELLAIDGLYRTAEDMDPQFIGRPMQVWLEGNAIRMTALT